MDVENGKPLIKLQNFNQELPNYNEATYHTNANQSHQTFFSIQPQPQVVYGYVFPSTNMALSLVSCLFVLPIGILAVLYSLKAQSAIKERNLDKANAASNSARIMAISSIVVGLNLSWIAYLINFLFGRRF